MRDHLVDKCNIVRAVTVSKDGYVRDEAIGSYIIGFQNKMGYTLIHPFDDEDIIIEAFDAPEQKAMLTEEVLTRYPDKYFIAAAGMAGLGSANDIRTQRIGKRFYLCGDGVRIEYNIVRKSE